MSGSASDRRGASDETATRGQIRADLWKVALVFLAGVLATTAVVQVFGLRTVLRRDVVAATDVHLVSVAPWETALFRGEVAVVVGLVLGLEALAYVALRPYLTGGWQPRGVGSRRPGWCLCGLGLATFALGAVLGHVYLTPAVVDRLLSGSPVLTVSQWGSLLVSVSVLAGVVAQVPVLGLALALLGRGSANGAT
ncbi:twin-arginine translocase subunit TatC [Halobacteriales archaeon Cl-PHB]